MSDTQSIKEYLEFMRSSPSIIKARKVSPNKLIDVIVPFGCRGNKDHCPNINYHITLLQSISTQDIFSKIPKNEVIVYLIIDGKNIDLSIIPALFPDLSIIITKLPDSVGPGLCRNYGMLISNSDFITFADPDDYYPSNAFRLLLDTHRNYVHSSSYSNETIPAIVSGYMHETRNTLITRDTNGVLLPKSQWKVEPIVTTWNGTEATTVMGKLFIRRFIEQFDIYFPPKRSFLCEDSFFMKLFRSYLQATSGIEIQYSGISYYAANNPMSLTRDPDVSTEINLASNSIGSFIDVIMEIHSRLGSTKYLVYLANQACILLYYKYYMFTDMDPINDSYFIDAFNPVRILYETYNIKNTYKYFLDHVGDHYACPVELPEFYEVVVPKIAPEHN